LSRARAGSEVLKIDREAERTCISSTLSMDLFRKCVIASKFGKKKGFDLKKVLHGANFT
jgi:hypothetical protein